MSRRATLSIPESRHLARETLGTYRERPAGRALAKARCEVLGGALSIGLFEVTRSRLRGTRHLWRLLHDLVLRCGSALRRTRPHAVAVAGPSMTEALRRPRKRNHCTSERRSPRNKDTRIACTRTRAAVRRCGRTTKYPQSSPAAQVRVGSLRLRASERAPLVRGRLGTARVEDRMVPVLLLRSSRHRESGDTAERVRVVVGWRGSRSV